MNDDRLIGLLKRADATARTLSMRDDLVASVRQRVARRQRLVRLVSITGIAAAAAIVMFALRLLPANAPRTDVPTPVAVAQLSDTEVTRLRTEIARFDREAVALRSVIQRTRELEARALRTRNAVGEPSDARSDAARELATAAYVALLQAERLETTSELLAAAAYRDVVEVFPETTWAEQALRRLAALSGSNGGTS